MRKNFSLLALVLLLAFATACEPINSDEAEGKNTENSLALQDQDPVEEMTGLEVLAEEDFQYSKSLKIKRLAEDYIYVDMVDGAERVLLVPKDKDFLDLEEEDLRQIHYPVENIGVLSTTHVALFRAIGQLDKIAFVNYEPETWYIDGVVDRMESGEIDFVGNYYDLDYERIQEDNPDLVLRSSFVGEEEEKLNLKLDDLGIPNMGISQYVEEDPRGRIEWVKLIGILVGAQEEAQAYLEDQYARIDKVVEESKALEKSPTIASFRVGEDGTSVKRSGDYSIKMFELAGGTYGLAGLVEEGTGAYKITPEEFYAQAQDMDILIHENMGTFIETKDQLLQYGDYLGDLKALKEGRVYATKENYWQEMDKTAEMIEDLHAIIKGEATGDLYFYQEVK